MKSPLHHLKHPEWFFEYFHQKIHHAFVVFWLAIIGMLRGASHIFMITSAARQRWGFITSDFRDQNPTSENITYALFWDGTPGSTAYTRLRDSSCVPTNVVSLSALWGGPLIGDTIYVIDSGSYTINSTIGLSGDCLAIIGKGNVIFKAANASIGTLINSPNTNHIILDNISIEGQNQWTLWVYLDSSDNISINALNVSNHSIWIYGNSTANISVTNTRAFNNQQWGLFALSPSSINNSLFFDNANGIRLSNTSLSASNSQFFNNTYGINAFNSLFTIDNSVVYNTTYWIRAQSSTWTLNALSFYNNQTWITLSSTGSLEYYGILRHFGNTAPYSIEPWSTFHAGTSPLSSWSAGQIDSWSSVMSYDRVTNPQNSAWQWLLSGSNRSALRWIQSFDHSQKPFRYVFWGNIPKQSLPVRYHGTTLEPYGTDGYDYSSLRYIAEPESMLTIAQQSVVNTYFWSWSKYTQNRQTNWCSLSAFNVKTLSWGIFNTTFNFEDHTIYLLTNDEYRSNVGGSSNGFVFNGNCIALIGTGNTRFTKSGWGGLNSILYANDKHNIIIDSIKIDGLYYGSSQTSTPAKSAIKMDGSSNNSTFNALQAYNTSSYGIYLGALSHHNTVSNTQAFNNGIAGIHLYYSSNYNFINNSQSYNNTSYGIRFANGSNRNAINNFQAYNNAIGIFWDLTTQENIINRVALYNNSDAGISLKNSSGNMLNDVRAYHNALGIRTLYSSQGNKYYGELSLFDNVWGNFDGTSGTDAFLSPWTAGLFPYAGTLSTGASLFSCLYATNPILSWTALPLLNSSCSTMGYVPGFVTPETLYVNYIFGLNVYKQKTPVRYTTGSTLIQLPSQYDSTKYIAETSALNDTTPESMSFVSSGSAQLHVRYATNIYTAGVINVSVPASLILTPATASGYLVINGTATWLTWTINNGDTLQVYLFTSAWNNQTITWTVTVWTVTTSFTVTTRWLSQTPDTGSFAFANLTSIPLNTLTGSSVVVRGIETGVLASITFDPLGTSWWLYVYSWSTLISSWTSWLLIYSGNTIKALAKSSSWYAQTVTGYVTIGLWSGQFSVTTKWSDTVPPTTPSLLFPLSGEKMFFVTFERNASTDTGSWIEGYDYQIATDSGFIHIVDTGIMTTTGTLGSPDTDFDDVSSKYYVRIKAQDKDGNTSNRSNIGIFKVVDFDNRSLEEENNANLKTYYDSDEITIEWITTWTSIRASVTGSWVLYKNWIEAGSGAWVQNDDIIYVTLKSSTDFDDTISTTLTIANRSLDYSITTKSESWEGCTLSDTDKATIQTIFDTLLGNYSWTESKYNEFLNTMQSMLADEIDFTNDCNLQYLEDLINSKLGIYLSCTVSTWTHIAPNCKEYPVAYDTTIRWYTSPTFKVITYFANRDALARYIDAKNPGECHINTYSAASRVFTNTDPSRHVASNGKIYTISYGSQWYTANELVVKKYFPSLSDLRNYIDSKNLPQAVRSHQVDTSFTPQAYTAPNSKTYTIYKTDRWYMSYKLMKVRYFDSLSAIQSYISINNPR